MRASYFVVRRVYDFDWNGKRLLSSPHIMVAYLGES
jgi:hypothetical protein